MKGMKRILAAILIAALAVPLTIVLPKTEKVVQASTNGHSQAEAVAWARNMADNHVYCGECVALIQKYYLWLGVSVPNTNANTYANADHIPNGWYADNTPSLGSVYVESNYSPGHVSIVVGIDSNGTLTTVDSNVEGSSVGQYNAQYFPWTTGRKRSDYAGVAGKSFVHPDFSNIVSVSFSNWESPGKTYFGATDASIGQTVNVSGGSWTRVGMILYDNSGKELGRAGDTPTAGISQYYYRINEELKVRLTPDTTYKYRFFADVSGTRHYSGEKTFKTLPFRVTFSSWESNGRTYIRETDASIGQRVDVSGGSWTGVGMILYDNNRNELGQAGDTPTAGIPQYYYKINEELHVTLKHATTYQYKFYAVIDGNTHYSDFQTFTTPGSHSWDNGKVTKAATTMSTGTKTFTCTVCGETKKATIPKLAKKANPLKVKVSKKTYKQAVIKNKARSFSIGVSKAQGKVTYTLNKKAKKAKIKVSKKGKVLIPKKCKKGTYKIVVKAAGNSGYKAGTKTVTIKIK